MNNNVKFLAMGCRLNIVEAEKIRNMLENAGLDSGIVINTCAVTGEAERQSKQTVRKIARENPGVPLFVTGCTATRDPETVAEIPGVERVVSNRDKMDIRAYLPDYTGPESVLVPLSGFQTLSKGFVQIQNGCNHSCAYCIVSSLRGKNVSLPYDEILESVRALVKNGYAEIVLTGVDIAGYMIVGADKSVFRIADLCAALLRDVPDMERLRLSSMDPAVDLRPIIDLMAQDSRMLPHLHLSMQSGSDTVLRRMGRRHTAEIVRGWVEYANANLPAGRPQPVTFSWDIICGFPGETDDLFKETCELVRKLKTIRLHAFPFSPRPGTAAADMTDQVPRATSKARVKTITAIANENMREFMESKLGDVVSVLVEENNMARDADDIAVKIDGRDIPSKMVVDVRLDSIIDGPEFCFAGTPC